MSVDIGSRIKEIRKSQRITLKALSQAAGLSESYLSQVERGVCAASVSSLEKIAEVLKINMDVLVQEEQEIPTAARRYSYSCPSGENFYYKRLSDNADGKRIDCCQITMLPGHAERKYPLEESGFLYVLSGYLNIGLNGAEECLYPGDSICYHPSMRLSCWNNSPFLTEFLRVTYLNNAVMEET